MTPMDHLHRFQEMLRISEKLPAGNIPVPNSALQVEWLYMSYHKSDRAEFVRSGNKLNVETLQTLTEYFQGIHDVKISDGSLQQKREDQIRQSTRCKMRGELEKRYHDKMSRYTHSRDKRQHANDKCGHDDNSKRVASNTNNCARLIIVPERIFAVTARHLRRERTRTLSPVTCMEWSPSICMTSAGVIQKMQTRRTSLATMLTA
jgi:hypothetical protein